MILIIFNFKPETECPRFGCGGCSCSARNVVVSLVGIGGGLLLLQILLVLHALRIGAGSPHLRVLLSIAIELQVLDAGFAIRLVGFTHTCKLPLVFFTDKHSRYLAQQ